MIKTYPAQGVPEENVLHANHTLEKEVLAHVIISKTIPGELTRNSFNIHDHKRIFDAIDNLLAKGEPVDHFTIHAQMGAPVALGDNDGFDYLVDLGKIGIPGLNIDAHVRLLNDLTMKIKVITFADLIATGVKLGNRPTVEIIADAAAKLRELAEGAGSHTPLLAFYDGAEVFNRNDPVLEPVFENLVYPGFALFVGRPKSGKSWLTLQMALALVMGQALAGWLRTPTSGPVLYLALEEPPSRTSRRMKQVLGSEDPRNLESIRFVYETLPMQAGGLEQLDNMLSDWPAKLTIIDTLRAFSRTVNKNSDIVSADYLKSDAVRRIAQKHATAILGVDHSRKAAGDLIDIVLGTTGVTGGADAIIGLEKTVSGDAVLSAKGREHEEIDYALRFDKRSGSFGWSIFGEGDEARQSPERAEIIELLRHESPLMPAKIAMLLKKNANTTRVLCSHLVKAGKIVKVEKGYVLVPGA